MGRFATSTTRATGDDSIGHEDGRVEAHVELLIREQGTLSPLDNIMDGDVIEYDSGVQTSKLGCKFSRNELAVANEFPRAMGEGKFNSFRCELPGRRPISCCGNVPFCISHSKADFCIADVSLSLFINCSAVERGEEVVEVKNLSSEDPIPLRVGNSSGGILGHMDKSSCSRDVPGVDSNSFTSLGEAGIIRIRRDGIDPTGRQFRFGESLFLGRRVVDIVRIN